MTGYKRPLASVASAFRAAGAQPLATTSHHYQDPMVEMRDKGVDMSSSGVFCNECKAERSRLDAQWGGPICAGCRLRARNALKPPGTTDGNDSRFVVIGVAGKGPIPVRLGDIDDIYGYVTTVVKRRFFGFDPSQQEEYIAEGVQIAYRLHKEKWKPDLQPSFSKYLSTLLWQRLKDFYRVDMRQSGRGCRGQSEFEYREVDSLDALREIGMEPAAPDVGGLAA